MEVNSFWHGGKLPPHSWLCLKSFVDHGHKVILHAYEPVVVPTGVTVTDARAVLPASRIFFYKTSPGAGSVSGFTNLFRYALLLAHGGWWADTDVLCLSSELPMRDVAFAWEAEEWLGNAVLRFPADYWLLKKLYEVADESSRERPDELQWGEIGPQLLTHMARDAELLGEALPAATFYPIPWTEAQLILQPERHSELQERTKDSILFHLWSEAFRRIGHDWQAPPPAGSYLSHRLSFHGLSWDECLQS